MKKPEIEYPCEWSYKIIGSDSYAITNEISEILKDHDYQLDVSNHSRTGKFVSFNCSLEVASENERNEIFRQFLQISSVKMVI